MHAVASLGAVMCTCMCACVRPCDRACEAMLPKLGASSLSDYLNGAHGISGAYAYGDMHVETGSLHMEITFMHGGCDLCMGVVATMGAVHVNQWPGSGLGQGPGQAVGVRGWARSRGGQARHGKGSETGSGKGAWGLEKGGVSVREKDHG